MPPTESRTLHLVASPDSWGIWFAKDPKQMPWQRYLDEVAAVGFKWTELGPPGYLPSDRTRLTSELQSRGLKVPAAFVIGALAEQRAHKQLDEQVRRTCETLTQLGATYLVLIEEPYRDIFSGASTGSRVLDKDSWRRLIDKTNQIGRLVQDEFGLQLAFHPHADTHVELMPQVEALLAQTVPDLVGICLDFGHVAYRGGNSVDLLKRHCGRIKYLHLKCVDPDVREVVLTEDLPFGQAVARRVFCEPSHGVPDFRAVAEALRACGYSGWATVEQDLYPCDFNEPVPIVQRWVQYLQNIKLGG